jgi:glycogen operon protein
MLEWDERGERVLDDTFLLLFNGATSAVNFTLPRVKRGAAWGMVLTTVDPGVVEGTGSWPGHAKLALADRSVTILRRVEGAGS